MSSSENDVRSDLRALEVMTDDAARNALALRLAESRTPGLAEVLIRLIGRDDLRGQRAALVHSLGYLDCSDHIVLLAELIVGGDLEVAHEAFQIVDVIDAAPDEGIEKALAATRRALAGAGLEDWRRALLEDLADLFD